MEGKPGIQDTLVKTEDNKVPLHSQRAHEIIDKMKVQHAQDWANMSAAYDGRKLLVSNSGKFRGPTRVSLEYHVPGISHRLLVYRKHVGEEARGQEEYGRLHRDRHPSADG